MPAPDRLEEDLVAVVGRRLELLQQVVVLPNDGSTSSSRDRIALTNACLKVRPIAIASPTDCIDVWSCPSAPGNFSKANRGHLTTT